MLSEAAGPVPVPVPVPDQNPTQVPPGDAAGTVRDKIKINLSISSQNCNSINVSSSYKNMCMKIAAICKLGTDIIFLSDVRLGKKNKEVTKLFEKEYKCLFNSSISRRGVGILYKKDLDIEILDTYKDDEENILAISCKISGSLFTLVSIYGPNTDDNRLFFDNLDRCLGQWQGSPVILGGDWNTTVSNLPANINPDVFRMNSIPSLVRSNWLADTMERFNLLDPFRLLSPTHRDYSYHPFGLLRNNRSRIDFFLISQDVSDAVRSATILNSFSKKCFDHRPIFMQLGKRKLKGRPAVNNRIISHPLLTFFSLLAVYETYIVNTAYVHNGIIHNIIRHTITQLTEVETELNNALSYCDSWGWRPLGNEDKAARDICIININNVLSDVISLEELSEYPRRIEDDIFFEELNKNINNSVLQLQRNSCGRDKERIKLISSELLDLRKNFDRNFLEIRDKEELISEIYEAELQDKVQNFIKDDILTNEKMCPKFLQLAKACKSESMAVIKDNLGNVFESTKARGEFIRNFYSDLYKIPDGAGDNLDGCVERFLGPDICSNPLVTAMRLTEDEKDRLDRGISLQELDKALETSNKKSAPGIDGVSNRLIEKIWQFIRKPLLRYAECCFRKGGLTKTFKTACIKIIPKKGDLSRIKNWRPISLLSCYYKLISRVINARLGTVIHKVTGRCQKAYNNKRHIHEVLINLTNSIGYCNINNEPGVIISIDQQKAFDSIYHGYCTDAYRFFGFGERFIDMMNILGTNRVARIIMEDGSLSSEVSLDRGRPQGDSPSPRQYNIGQQICLIKIEFDPDINRLEDNPPIVRPLEELPAGLVASEDTLQGGGATNCFADDTNVCSKQKAASVGRIKDILIDFEQISGLKCNIEKTCIMFIGPRDPVEATLIEAMGFLVVEKMKILGIWIRADGEILNENFELATHRIRKIIATWSQFNLSLIGRIAISKTYLISQLTYIGSVLSPDAQQLLQINKMIEEYVLNKMPFARDRLYTKPEHGGLGLIDLGFLMDSLKSSWFKRILDDGIIDNWRLNLMKKCYFDITCFRPGQLDKNMCSMEFNIGTGFWNFLQSFWATNHNFLNAPIVDNTFIVRGVGDNGRVDNRTVDRLTIGIDSYYRYKKAWLKLKVSDMLFQGTIISHPEMVHRMGIQISVNTYLAVRRAVSHTLVKFNNKKDSDGSCTGITEFLTRRGKGAKKFRKIMCDARHLPAINGPKKVSQLANRYSDICAVWVGPDEDRTALAHFWTRSYLPLDLRLFSFQLFNNSLPVGARLGNRYLLDPDRVIDVSCQFCTVPGFNLPLRETFKHLFFECPTTGNILEQFRNKYWPDENTETVTKLILYGTKNGKRIDSIRQVVSILFLHCIWKARSRKKISFATVENNMEFIFTSIVKNNKKLTIKANCSNFSWCRTWWRDGDGDGLGHG